jgi:hypothetical protein
MLSADLYVLLFSKLTSMGKLLYWLIFARWTKFDNKFMVQYTVSFIVDFLLLVNSCLSPCIYIVFLWYVRSRSSMENVSFKTTCRVFNIWTRWKLQFKIAISREDMRGTCTSSSVNNKNKLHGNHRETELQTNGSLF